eukprot:1694969-Prymnesium_polylepis.2
MPPPKPKGIDRMSGVEYTHVRTWITCQGGLHVQGVGHQVTTCQDTIRNNCCRGLVSILGKWFNRNLRNEDSDRNVPQFYRRFPFRGTLPGVDPGRAAND